MVFGNMGDDCATGVCFTRDPSTGENMFYGEYLVNAQGEDVVAGIRTPQPMSKARAKPGEAADGSRPCPRPTRELLDIRAHARDSTTRTCRTSSSPSSSGKLYMLQTRNGKRTAAGRLRIAVEMAHEGLIDQKEAVTRVNPSALDQLLHPTLDPKAHAHAARQGPARQPRRRRPAPSCSPPTKPKSRADQGRGGHPGPHRDQPRGHPRHARRQGHPHHPRRHDQPRRRGRARHGPALRRRRRRHLTVDYNAQTITRRRQAPSMPARSSPSTAPPARCSSASVPMIEPALSGDFGTLMDWADKHRRMKVRANAETPLDAETARKFGAEGIGLCRTEHMFFDPERISAVRQMILAA